MSGGQRQILPEDWDLRRMPWLELTDGDGRTVMLSVAASRPPSGPARVQVGEVHGSPTLVDIELAGIGDAERLLALIEALAGRTWESRYVGKAH